MTVEINIPNTLLDQCNQATMYSPVMQQ